MGAHARLGPSNHRWPHCPGSIREEAQYQDFGSAAAIDGTGSHLLLEMCLLNGVRAESYDGQVIGVGDHENPMGWMVGPDRIERVQMCLDYVTRRVNELKAKYPGQDVTVEAETKGDPGGAFGRTDWWGTIDITVTVPGVFVEIIDYKDGRGWVSEKSNTQLGSYAFGKIRPFVASGPDLVRPFRPEALKDGVRMTIVQPKTTPVVRYEEVTAAEVVQRAENLAIAARRTDDPDAPLVSGKHCQWCKANPKRGGHCTAESTKSMGVLTTMGNNIIAKEGVSLFEIVNQAISDTGSMTPEQLAELSDAREGIMVAFDKVDTEIERRLEQGDTVPGYAMKPGRASRVWNDEPEAIAKMLKGRRLTKDDIYPPSLVSPAQLMKCDKLTDEQKQKIERDFIATKAGKMKLTKVARGEESKSLQKDVAQRNDDVEQLFSGVKPSIFAESDAEVSFL